MNPTPLMAAQTLHDIATQIEETGNPRQITVRQLLAAIDQKRRGRKVMNLLRAQMRKARLKTDPDFWGVPLDTRVTVSLGPPLGRRPSKPWHTSQPQPTQPHSQIVAIPDVPISESVVVEFAPLLAAMRSQIARLNESGAEAFKRVNGSVLMIV